MIARSASVRRFSTLAGISLSLSLALAGCEAADPVEEITGGLPVEESGMAAAVQGIDQRPDLERLAGYGFTRAAAPASPSYSLLAAPTAGHTIERTSTTTEVEITFEGLRNYDAAPTTAYASFPKWIAHIDMDVSPGFPTHTGNFANEPSPSAAIFWYYEGAASKSPSSRTIDFDRPVSRVSIYYAACLSRCQPPLRRGETRPPTLPHITMSAFAADGTFIDSITGGQNWGEGTGDPTGDFNKWTQLTVELGENDNRISKVRITGYEEYVGVDDVGFLIVNFAPVAVPGGPYTGTEGALVAFDGGVSFDPVDAAGLPHPKGDAVTYHWDFGDGNTSTLAKPKHPYESSGEYTATLTVTDPNAVPSVATVPVSIGNVAPTVAAGADAQIAGGQVFSRTGSFVDPGNDDWTATVDYGDGSGEQPLALSAAKTFSLSHTYTSRGSYTVVVKVDDQDGGVGTDEVLVTVGNRAPAVEAGPGASLVEGATYSFDGSFTDADAGDSWSATVHYGDGGDWKPLALGGDKTFTLSHEYADDGEYEVRVKVSDGQAESSAETTVSVTNSAPAVAAGPDAALVAGTAFSLGASFSDPGRNDGPWAYTIDWDDSQPDATGTVGAWAEVMAITRTHTFSEPGSYAVTVTVVDKDGATAEDGAIITVTAANGAPVAVINAPSTVVEGVLATFSASGSMDPDGGALTYAWTLGTGDGEVAISGVEASYAYPNEGTYPVSLTVTDAAGASDTESYTATVDNGAPTAIFTAAPLSVTVGGMVDLGLTDPLDVPADLAELQYAFTCGSADVSDGTSGATCTFTEVGEVEVTGTISDADGGSTSYAATVVVSAIPNGAPLAVISAPAGVLEGVEAEFSGLASTDDSGIVEYVWSFGVDADGSGEEDAAEGAEVAYAFPEQGDYIVTLTVADAGGATSTTTEEISVGNVAPTANFAATPLGVIVGGTTTLSLTDPVDVAADLSELSYSFTCGGGPAAGGGSTATCTFSEVGEVEVTGTISDGDGGSTSYAATVVVSPVANPAPVPVIEVGEPIVEGSPAQFSGLTSTDDGEIVGYAWTFGIDSNGDWVEESSTEAEPSFTYIDDGSFTVTLTVTDDGGKTATASRSLTVGNVAPTSTFSAPETAVAGTPITLGLTGADASPVDAADLEYVFDCGSGEFSSDTGTATCTFTGPGSSTVSGKVRDKDGAESERQQVVVAVTAPSIQIVVDVKPESINLPRGGRVPTGEMTVHVRSTSNFDARSIDPSTVTLAGILGGGATRVIRDRNGQPKVTGGNDHVVFHFERAALFINGALTPNTTEMYLAGALLDGFTMFRGSDRVRITGGQSEDGDL